LAIPITVSIKIFTGQFRLTATLKPSRVTSFSYSQKWQNVDRDLIFNRCISLVFIYEIEMLSREQRLL